VLCRGLTKYMRRNTVSMFSSFKRSRFFGITSVNTSFHLSVRDATLHGKLFPASEMNAYGLFKMNVSLCGKENDSVCLG